MASTVRIVQTLVSEYSSRQSEHAKLPVLGLLEREQNDSDGGRSPQWLSTLDTCSLSGCALYCGAGRDMGSPSPRVQFVHLLFPVVRAKYTQRAEEECGQGPRAPHISLVGFS